MSSKLLQLLDNDVVCLNLEAKSADDVIKNLGERLLKNGFVKESFVKAVLESEKILPTGIPLEGELNAAIPHTDTIHVLKPGVALATLKYPVIFNNMVKPEEKVNVRLVFLLSLEHPKSQVEMLKEIAGVLQKPEAVERLISAATFEDVQAALS